MWMVLSLFGPDDPWGRLWNDEPILSGRHPLHLYHGWLGSQALLARGKPCCFDPGFQAGYPKTPVFDGGSRPAELCLLLAGGVYRPAAYKIGLALWCAVVPLVLAAAARGAGLDRAAACLATFLGLLVWWGAPARSALEAGNLDLLLAAPAAVLQAGLVIRFDRAPGLLTWLGILASGAAGWFAHPLFFALLLPLVLVFLLSVANRHRLVWHLALLAGLLGAVAVNGFWLIDWVSHLWIREPLHLESRLLSHRTFHTLWNALFWGEPADRALALALAAAAVVGAGCLNQCRQRPAARFLGLGAMAPAGRRCWCLPCCSPSCRRPTACSKASAWRPAGRGARLVPVSWRLGSCSSWPSRRTGTAPPCCAAALERPPWRSASPPTAPPCWRRCTTARRPRPVSSGKIARVPPRPSAGPPSCRS
jgi:hypothetical protein